MVTCRDLLQLDIFKNIPLVAGQAGLDRVISWPYAKHTKVITPWVQGGEFVLVSGYELGVNEEELLVLLDEAVTNRLSGLLIEGGINFKTLTDRVAQRADEAEIPIFFASRVVSFLDISRDIASLILETQMAEKYTSSLLEKVLSSGSASRQELRFLFEAYGISPDSYYKLFLFSLSGRTAKSAEEGQKPESANLNALKQLQVMCNKALLQMGLKAVSRPTLGSVAYLTYGPTEMDFANIRDVMEQVREQFSGARNHSVTLASSSLIPDITGIVEGFNQAVYTASLMESEVITGPVNSFDDLGSYQFLFYVEDKGFLLRFRDRFLKKLYDSDQSKNAQLLETLEAFLANGGNMLRTAEILHIHRNTLQYRLDRIGSITEQNLNDADVRRDFQNALMLLALYPYR